MTTAVRPPEEKDNNKVWNIVIVDDEPDVFHVTELVLRRFTALGRPVMLQHCESDRHAREFLAGAEDIAVVITDVVMERDDSGLSLVRWVREQPHLNNTRIVIRTGQPGLAPEQAVLNELDINDYWTKQDLSSRRLQTLLVGLLRSYRDLTALSRTHQKTSQELLAERRALSVQMARNTLFHSVSESLTAGTILVKSGQVLYANSTAAALLGCDEESIADTLQEHLQLSSPPRQGTIELKLKDGLRWLDVHTTPVQQDTIHGDLLTLTDITARVEMAEARLRSERDLMRSQHLEQIGMLTSGVAHDLNNILTIIIGSAQYLGGVSEPGEVRQCVDEIVEAGQTATALVQQLMLYGSGGQAIRKPTELKVALHQALRIWIGEARKRNILIEFIAEPEPPLWAEIAESQIQQIVANLISNALRISAASSTLRVSLFQRVLSEGDLAQASVRGSAQPGRFAVLCFEDSGLGMTEETRQRLFEPFYTTHSTGRGLGLATVKQIALHLGAAISVSSQLGRGSRFEVAIPCISAQKESEVDGALVAPVAKQRILVLDDTIAVCRLLCRILKRAGYEPLPAQSVERALEYTSSRIDLGIIDFVLEGTTGNLALQRLREEQPELPAILCSGYISPSHHERLREFRQIIHKPFSEREVLEAVKNHIGAPPSVINRHDD